MFHCHIGVSLPRPLPTSLTQINNASPQMKIKNRKRSSLTRVTSNYYSGEGKSAQVTKNTWGWTYHDGKVWKTQFSRDHPLATTMHLPFPCEIFSPFPRNPYIISSTELSRGALSRGAFAYHINHHLPPQISMPSK